MTVIQAPGLPSSNDKVKHSDTQTTLKQTPVKVESKSIPPVQQAKTEEKPFAHRVRRWWELMLPEGKSLSAKAEAYLQDETVPWSKEGFQHVLTPSKKWIKSNFGASCLSEDVQDEIILAIFQRVCEAPEPNLLTQPVIHFVGHHVYVSLLTTQALLHLWKSPPIFRDDPMEFVSKGLFYKVPRISHFKKGTAMSKDAFVEQFKIQYTPHIAAQSSDSGLQIAYARFYEVSGIPGGPVFSGQVLMFSNDLDTADVHKPFFVKENPLDFFSFSRPTKIRAAE